MGPTQKAESHDFPEKILFTAIADSRELAVSNAAAISSRKLARACADFLWRQDATLQPIKLAPAIIPPWLLVTSFVRPLVGARAASAEYRSRLAVSREGEELGSNLLQVA
jgi:hypothetical protein